VSFPGWCLGLNHRQLQIPLTDSGEGDFVTGGGMAHHAGDGVVFEYPGNGVRGISAVADHRHGPVLRKLHTHNTTLLQGTTGGNQMPGPLIIE